MPAKKVSIGKKPVSQETNIDEWVATRSEELTPQAEATPKLKRLTIDLPEPLHRAIKMKAVSQGIPMADMLRELLKKHYLVQ